MKTTIKERSLEIEDFKYQLIGHEELCALLDVSSATGWRIIGRGDVPSFKVGSLRRMRLIDVINAFGLPIDLTGEVRLSRKEATLEDT